jgi:tetratricopeptide (TPR) repeat protein
VALADPELELLREILDEDPSDPAYLEVAREYVRRGDWPDAIRVLIAATDAGATDAEAWSMLAIASFEASQYLRALSAIDRFGADVAHSDLLSRLKVLALERSGQGDRAKSAALAHLAGYPDDHVVAASLRRLQQAPTPTAEPRRADPMINAARAEAYVAVGRVDRAIRVYRRLAFQDPGDMDVRRRLRELEGVDLHGEDDLSEELSADMEADRPPGLAMPYPGTATPAPHQPVPHPPTPTAVPAVDRPTSSVEMARRIEEQRRATGAPGPRSVVPEDRSAPRLTPSGDILRATQEVDLAALALEVREAKERKARRRSLIRK